MAQPAEQGTDINGRLRGDTAGHLLVSRRSLLLGSLAAVTGAAASCTHQDRILKPDITVARKSRIPAKVVGLYCRGLTKNPLDRMPHAFNVLYLFAATRALPAGRFTWDRPDIAAAVKVCRKREQRIILTVGGADDGLIFASRQMSQRLVYSVANINRELGGTDDNPVLDGVDFNTFEGDHVPILSEYQWMSTELRNRFGSDFGITCPPAPWRLRDQEFCREMLASDCMDYIGPQFYDGPGLSNPDYIISETDRWVTDVAAGNANKVVVGFGIGKGDQYSTIQQISTAVQSIKMTHPEIRGAFLWEHLKRPRPHKEFAREVAPYL